jgi:hypothetical protein
MKRTILAIAAAMMMSASIMAQDNNEQQREPRRTDRTEMLKMRTEQMAKEYGLDEAQQKKLLEVNTQYADKLPMMMMGRRGGGPRGERPQAGQQRPQRPDSARQGGPRGERGQRPQWNREEMQKNMEAYNAELKTIMTEEQYAKYQADQEKRMQAGPMGRRGERPQRNNNN